MSRPHRGVGEALRRGDHAPPVTDIRAALTALGLIWTARMRI